MLKHSETIINNKVRRQDTTWDYRWDYYNPDKDGTIFLDPEMTYETNVGHDSWRFCGDADDLAITNPYIWDPKQPTFQYQVEDTESGEGPDSETDNWDAEHPRNLSRYLKPGDDRFIRINNSIQNVHINPNPPKFITDAGTEYLSKEAKLDGKRKKGKIYSTATRTLYFEFEDEVGLDYKQVAIYLGDEEIDWENVNPDSFNEFDDNGNIIYYYDRKLEKALKKHYVDDNIKFNATKTGTYSVEVSLYEKWADRDNKGNITNEKDIKEILNDEKETIDIKVGDETYTKEKYKTSKLNLIVWDLSGNYTIYHIKRPFNSISIEDMESLQKIEILFTSIEPDNFYLENGIEGRIVTKLQNPNVCLFEYENVAQLEESVPSEMSGKAVGQIDISSYEADDNRYHVPLDGIREFIITHITESGYVVVEAWVETGFAEIDAEIKERTYNEAICGPWIYGAEGRKYNIMVDVPKFLEGNQFGDFMEFFQLYINTIYKGLDENKNISALEKIARIGNMNDIQQIEDSLVYHYAKEHGNEFDFNIESLKNVNLVNNGIGFTNRDVKDTFDIVKYVLDQLPNYNSYKGTNTGIQMAIKMFGFTCKVINLWCRIENEVEENPIFVEEDRLLTKNGNFMTSRFTVELDGSTNLFEVFNENVDMFIKLIKSIKPLCKILDLIKYTIYVEKNMNLIYDLNTVTDDLSDELTYEMKWTFDKNHLKDVKNIKYLCKLNDNTGTADLFCLNYHPDEYSVVDSKGNEITKPSMVHDILGKLFTTHYKKLYLKFTKHNGELIEKTTYEFNEDGIIAVLNSGSLFMYFEYAAEATNCYNIIKKFFDFNLLENSSDYSVTVEMKFKLQPGTDYGLGLNPNL